MRQGNGWVTVNGLLPALSAHAPRDNTSLAAPALRGEREFNPQINKDMSDNTTSGTTPSGAPAENAGAPAAPVADWGADAGANRGSGLARGKRVTPQAAPASASNPAASGTSNTLAAATRKIEDGRECCHLPF